MYLGNGYSLAKNTVTAEVSAGNNYCLKTLVPKTDILSVYKAANTTSFDSIPNTSSTVNETSLTFNYFTINPNTGVSKLSSYSRSPIFSKNSSRQSSTSNKKLKSKSYNFGSTPASTKPYTGLSFPFDSLPPTPSSSNEFQYIYKPTVINLNYNVPGLRSALLTFFYNIHLMAMIRLDIEEWKKYDIKDEMKIKNIYLKNDNTRWKFVYTDNEDLVHKVVHMSVLKIYFLNVLSYRIYSIG